jgi:D-glycero-D-manno-heptose 1,7-bisphosphate phosphatase
MSARKRFVLLDRDGTIIVEKNYLARPDAVELIANAGEALRMLAAHGFGLIVITNQSGVGRGYFDEDRLRSIHDRLKHLLAAEGVALDGIYYCPHTPDEGCLCRKPGTALAELAARRHGFDPGETVVVGDKACDIELGYRIGAMTVLVQTGHGTSYLWQEGLQPQVTVANIHAAAQWIIATCVNGSHARNWHEQTLQTQAKSR